MQLTQIIRGASARLWAVALIPALALAALTFIITWGPADHQVTATVGVTSPSGSDSATGVTQAVDSFRSALDTSVVRDAAAGQLELDGVSADDVESNRVGVSQLVEIRVRAEDRDDLEPLALALVGETNDLVYGVARGSAEAQRAAAETELEGLLEEIASVSPAGSTLVLQRYQAKSAEVTQLRVAVVGAEARAAPETAGLRTALQQATRELRALSGQVRDLDPHTVALQRAQQRVADTSAAVSAIDAGLAAANEEGAVTFGPVAEQSETTMLTRALVAGLVVGVAVAVGLVLLLGALRRGGPRTGHRAS